MQQDMNGPCCAVGTYRAFCKRLDCFYCVQGQCTCLFNLGLHSTSEIKSSSPFPNRIANKASDDQKKATSLSDSQGQMRPLSECRTGAGIQKPNNGPNVLANDVGNQVEARM